MKARRRNAAMLVVLVAVLLVGCNQNRAVDGGISLPNHSHAVPEHDNVVGHDPVGYCGNTVTTVRRERPDKQGENWECSFWGGTSVSLTDFLRWLDFSDDSCRCLPEYYIKTEFGRSEYGISLIGGYVRYEGKQCQLTEEQLAWLTDILAEIEDSEGEELCALPSAERPVFCE